MNKDDVIRWASNELDSREFYDVMQAYRHSQDPKETPEAFEAVKEWIRKNISLAYAAGAANARIDDANKAADAALDGLRQHFRARGNGGE